MSKKNPRSLQIISLITTIVFGINTIVFGILSFSISSASAQTSESTTIGQIIDASAGALTMPCSLGDFVIDSVNIDTPQSYFSGYYTNQKIVDSDLTNCGGTGITVQDTRYNGGFVLQVAATEYLKDGIGPDSINVGNLAIVTEQISTSYIEDSSGVSDFVGEGGTLKTGSTGDNLEVVQALPFDLTLYGTTYPAGTNMYLCTNGSINFTSGNCSIAPSVPLESVLEESVVRILPYYKDLTTSTEVDPSFGIYYTEPSASTARIRWKGAPVAATNEQAEFEVLLTDNGTADTITFNYSSTITDTQTGPIVGITKGGPAGVPVTNTYTESVQSQQSQGKNLASEKSQLLPAGTDFAEAKKPGTPATKASANGNPSEDTSYINFIEDPENPGNSLNLDLISGNVDIGCGRVGLYTLYPSYRLNVPTGTADGTYTNTITYTLTDSTGPGNSSC
jgi:hypothetical protein